MKTYVKFLILSFLKSFFYVFINLLLVFYLLNILTELEFFRDIDVDTIFPLYLSLLNSPSLIFEMFPLFFYYQLSIFYKSI